MTIADGTRLGPYEIAARIGAGGMGEVWRASDTRIGREVAIKVLPPDWGPRPTCLLNFFNPERGGSCARSVAKRTSG